MASGLWIRNHSLLHSDSWTSLSLASCFASCPSGEAAVCTADPVEEPTVEVMNTLLSAMALDYLPGKLHVYLSDDGGSPVTLHGMREAWKFARWWPPFCRKYRVKNGCPEAYFSGFEDEDGDFATSSVFIADEEMIKEKYEAFKEEIRRIKKGMETSRDA